VEPLDLGSVNSNFRLRTGDGRAYFARIYEEQALPGAELETALLSQLSDQDVPVVRPLRAGFAHAANAQSSPRSVQLTQGKPFAIFPWIEGEWLCLQRVTSEHCRLVGEALARVHLAQVAPGLLGAGRFQPRDMLARLDRVETQGPASLRPELAVIRGKYGEYAARRDPRLPSGVCHGDLFRDNVLWQGPRIAALLDFESVSLGSFAYDLMVTVLAWCFRGELTSADAEMMVSGYDRVRPLSAAELDALEVESALACLRFATTRLTDFELRRSEGSPPGRDFRRFLLRLAAIEAGALKPIREGLERNRRAARDSGRNDR
jgi:homoserine kinase type II